MPGDETLAAGGFNFVSRRNRCVWKDENGPADKCRPGRCCWWPVETVFWETAARSL
jgi:hypothetical protein